ncbi:MAG: gliding motility lipoprotein GldD [Saprospiraceae bacterium]|nr:MAG: gliding motility lipoprotein GldD [Saprospiraceae bacterium]
MRAFLFFMLTGFLFTACEEPAMVPKPRGFPRVVYPEKSYQSFDKDYCSFTFDYPTYAVIQQDTSFFGETPAHPCWFDIYFPDFDSRLHCSFYPISKEKDFSTLKKDAFEMADWHNKRANYIDEIPINLNNQVSGFIFEMQGPAASPIQFYLTDSTRHFMRGALYFNTQTRPDSLAPVYLFLKNDVFKMIETFRWND